MIFFIVDLDSMLIFRFCIQFQGSVQFDIKRDSHSEDLPPSSSSKRKKSGFQNLGFEEFSTLYFTPMHSHLINSHIQDTEEDDEDKNGEEEEEEEDEINSKSIRKLFQRLKYLILLTPSHLSSSLTDKLMEHVIMSQLVLFMIFCVVDVCHIPCLVCIFLFINGQFITSYKTMKDKVEYLLLYESQLGESTLPSGIKAKLTTLKTLVLSLTRMINLLVTFGEKIVSVCGFIDPTLSSHVLVVLTLFFFCFQIFINGFILKWIIFLMFSIPFLKEIQKEYLPHILEFISKKRKKSQQKKKEDDTESENMMDDESETVGEEEEEDEDDEKMKKSNKSSSTPPSNNSSKLLKRRFEGFIARIPDGLQAEHELISQLSTVTPIDHQPIPLLPSLSENEELEFEEEEDAGEKKKDK